MELVNYTSEKELSIYRISKLSSIPLSTLNDIYSGKSSLFDCSGKTLLSLSKVLGVSIEELLEMKQEIYKPEFEKNVPIFLKNSLNNLKKCRRHKGDFYDCYLLELNSNINVCEVEHLISSEHANYLRNKYLRWDYE